MKKDIRTVVYDEELKIEAYRFEITNQTFSNHFHEEYYVIGFVEDGQRMLTCKNKECMIGKGSVVIFNPGDNHGCVQDDDGVFDYRGFHISKETMLDLAYEITGRRTLPGFSHNVIYDEEIVYYLRPLHEMVMNEIKGFRKEEMLLFLVSELIQRYGQPFENCILECRQEIEKACDFMERHYQEHIDLDQICHYAALSKSTLLRAFTKSKGMTPYRYLENIRINEAKKLLGQGMPPLEAAILTGFSDQSHLSNYFRKFIGLTPGVYREIFFDEDKDGKTYEA